MDYRECISNFHLSIMKLLNAEFSSSKGHFKRGIPYRLEFLEHLVTSYFNRDYKAKFLHRMLDSEGKSKELYVNVLEVMITESFDFRSSLNSFLTHVGLSSN